MDANSMMQDSHMNEMEDAQHTITAPKALLGDKELHVGDEITLKVKNIEGDNVELECAPEESGEMSQEEMGKMSSEDAEKMPMEEMEHKLPKARREY